MLQLSGGLHTVSNRKTSAIRRTTPKARHDPATDRLLRFAVEAGDLLPWEWNIASDTFCWGAPPTWLLGPLPEGAAAYPDLRQVVHPGDLERFLAAGREAKARTGTYQIEFRIVRGDGTARHILARGHSHAELGTTPTSIIGVIIDIEARKRAQDAAETLTAAQRALLDSLPDVTWLKNTQGHLTAVNRAFGERYGMAPETAVGRTDFDIYPDDKALTLRSEDAQIMSSRLPVRYESTQNVDGRDYWVEVVKAPIFDTAGNVIGTVGTSRDISARRVAERDLRDSKQRFRMLAELSSDWFWEQDADLHFTLMSDGLDAKAGLAAQKTLGKHRWELPIEGVSEAQWEEHRQLLAERKPFEMSYRLRNDAGEARWFHVKGRAVFRPDGSFQGYRGVGRDVTDRVNAEAELRLAKERLQMALAGSRLVLWDTDLTTGDVYLSEDWARLLGFPSGETRITSDGLMAMVHPADRPEVHRLSRETLRGERDEYVLEHRVRAADASWIWILSRGRVSARDAAGKPIRMSGTNLDITGRKSMETSLRQALRQSETLLETTPTAISVILDRVILRCNPAMERLFGAKPGELLGHSTRALFPSDADWEAAGKTVYEAIARGETFSGELEFVRQNGEHFWAVAAGRSIEPGSPQVLFAYTDVTTQQNLSRALAAAKKAADTANKAKSGFLAAMSHEIRTPMNGVLGMLELLELTELDGEQRETLTLARDSAVSLLRLIDEILDFSKIEAGQLEITPEPVSLVALANRAANVYRELASRKGVLLECKVDPRIAEAHMADGLRVSQIVNNLLSNAIKFTAQGKVALKLESAERGADDELVRLTVADTGIGVPPEHQGRLFQPFVQADSDTARVYGGTGLGLSICRRLAELMGGSIGLQSLPGLGTTVTVLLRFAVTDPSALQSREQARFDQLAAIGGRGHGATEAAGACILIADDHPINLMLIQRQAALLGYRTDLARDGVEALEKWKTGAYALVLTDCDMPRMDGYQLAREIRRLEAAKKTPRPIPIIACTANALASDATVCIDAGMNDYLSKPIALLVLQSKLAQWIGSHIVAADASAAAGRPPGSAAPPKPGMDGADPTSGEPPLDSITLTQFTGGDPKLRREILREFLVANAADAVALREALAGEDVTTIARAAHRAKGASRTVGAQPFADVAERIEEAARTENRTAVRGCVTDFEREQARLVECLRAETGERDQEEQR